MQRSFGWVLLLGLAVTATALCGSVAQASVTGDTISIAFARDEPPGTAGCALAATDVAGAPGYATANWINETTNLGTDSNLTRDTLGVASTTSAALTWTADNTWSTDGTRGEFDNAFPGADGALMNGYLDCGNGANGGFTEITVKNLPADIAAGYSVVIYTLGGVRSRPGQFFANGNGPLFVLPGGPGGATSYYQHAQVGVYAQAIGDDPANGPDSYGNYVVFTGLSGDLDVQAFPNGGGTPRASINAIQIVKNP
ncbi:MAG TPA: hypothetical protein VKU02_17265 [Gemmataceae bacterium]|nr:hypothetical protein [Gemmataceae bacterium]